METVRLRSWLGSLTVAIALAGCSAIINPDDGRLGGDFDAGPGTMDGGRADGGGADGGRDAGPTDGGPGDDGGPTCPASCDDGVACTSDSCVAGSCLHEADDGACSGGERCNPVLGCVPTRCASDPECSDGLYCNGAERCDASAPGTGCVAGAPIACNDGAGCTMDACDEDTDRCVSTPNDAACADTVDCTVDSCSPGGSIDASGCVHTPDASRCAGDFCTVGRVCNPTAGCVGGAARVCTDGSPCTDDTCDETTNMCDSALRDGDGDSYGPISVSGVACGGTDCDDGNGAIHPGATELCDGLDNNCNTMIDEGCPTTPDTCRTATAITLDSGGNGVTRGSFAGLADDYQTNPICNASTGGRDAVYYVDLAPGTWDLTIDTFGSAADTVLAVGLDCSMADFSAACNDDYTRTSISNDSRIWIHRITSSSFAPRRVYILVDAYSASVTGDYVVNVRRRNGAPDNCPTGGGAFPLDITGGGTVLGFQSSFVGSQRGSCQPVGDVAPEAIFRFDGDTSGNADFEVYSADFVPDIYVRTSPCGSGTQLGCDIGSSVGGGVNAANLRVGVTSGSLHYLFVDGGRTTYAVYYQPY
jgi:hypothetical protein